VSGRGALVEGLNELEMGSAGGEKFTKPEERRLGQWGLEF